MKLATATGAAAVALVAVAGPAEATSTGSNVVYGYVHSWSCSSTSEFCKVVITYGSSSTTTTPSMYGTVNNCAAYGVPNGTFIGDWALGRIASRYVSVVWAPPSAGAPGAINCH